MIRKALLIVAAVSLIAATIRAEVPTPNAVTRFYSGIAALTNTYNNADANKIESRMRNCFEGMMDSGINLSNDFRFFDYDKGSISHANKTLTSNNYINKLSEFAFKDKALKVSIRILKSEMDGSVPDFHSRRLASADANIKTYVTKSFILDGKEKVFNDTIYTNIGTGLIGNISNGEGLSCVDKNSLRIKAAQAYARKNYQKAYGYYEQIISIDSKDADAYYRLGLMTYWLQGCGNKFYKKKSARNKGKEYLSLAESYGYSSRNYTIRNKAGQVLHYIKYYNQ